MPVLGESDRNIMSQRQTAFKNRGISQDELRSRRKETSVELRKTKRDEQLMKRRRDISGESEDAFDAESTSAAGGMELTFSGMVQAIQSSDASTRLQAVQWFRKLLSKQRDPPIDEVINARGVLERLVSFLQPQHDAEPQLQLEAAWALTNIASGTGEQTRAVLHAGAGPSFIRLLGSDSAAIAEQSVWALGNIAGDSAATRDQLLSLGIMDSLLVLMANIKELSLARNAVWTLSNLCRGKTPAPDIKVVMRALPVLARYIFSTDQEIMQDAAWALSFISDGDTERIDAVVSCGAVRRVVELLASPSADVVAPAVRVIGNIVTGTATQTQAVLNCGSLQFLLPLLNHPKENIRKETCWTLSNIGAGTVQQVQAIIDHNIVPMLLETLKKDSYKVKKEAAWAVNNIVNGGTEAQVKYMVKQGCIPAMVHALKMEPAVIINTLQALDKMLKVGQAEAQAKCIPNQYADFLEEAGGVDIIEELQSHEKDEVYKCASRIINLYYSDEEPDASTAGFAPQVSENNQYVFGHAHPGQANFHF